MISLQNVRLSVGALALGLLLAALPAGPSSAAPLTIDVFAGQSVATALKTVAPGGTVVVHAGTYPALTLSSWTWTSQVTLRAAAGETVTFAGITLTKVSKLTLSGIRTSQVVTFDGGNALDLIGSAPLGVTVKNGAYDVDITDNDIVGGWNGVAVVSWSGAAHPHHVRIADNRISGQDNDNIQIGIADDVTVEDNVLRDPVMNDNHNDGVQFMGGERLVVRRNRFSGQDQAMMIQPEDQLGTGNHVSDLRLENNIVSATRGAGFIVSDTDGTSIVNNTIYDTPYASIHLVGQNTDLEITNDVVKQIWQEAGASAPTFEDYNCVISGGRGLHDVRTDPKFVDRVDYRLTATSPCRDLGRLTNAPLDDFDQVLRGSLPDAGAREVVGP